MNKRLAWAIGIAILVVLALDIVALVSGPRDGVDVAGPTPTVGEISPTPSPELSPSEITPTPTFPEASPTGVVSPGVSPPLTPTAPPTGPVTGPTPPPGTALTGTPIAPLLGLIPLIGGLALFRAIRRPPRR